MIRNVILDWSGTLVDDFPPTLIATNAVLEACGKPALSEVEFRTQFRLPYPEFYEEVVPGEPLERLEELFKAAFLEHEDLVKPLAPTRDFLRAAESCDVRLFVLTSMNAEAFERQSKAFGLAPYFEETYAGVLDKREQLGRILEEHGLLCGETAYVGDMTHDLEAAREAGVMGVGVLSGYDSAEKLTGLEPDYLIPDVSGITQMFGIGAGDEVRQDVAVNKLRVLTRIGVPEIEREMPQEVAVSLAIEVEGGIESLGDDLGLSVDYFVVSERVKEVAGTGERRLIETLAEDLCAVILDEFEVSAVVVEIEKFILTNCESVSVKLARRAS
ncbi:MAG: dihydroneopterin aldolase [Verrucomicrobiota bacterium]